MPFGSSRMTPSNPPAFVEQRWNEDGAGAWCVTDGTRVARFGTGFSEALRINAEIYTTGDPNFPFNSLTFTDRFSFTLDPTGLTPPPTPFKPTPPPVPAAPILCKKCGTALYVSPWFTKGKPCTCDVKTR